MVLLFYTTYITVDFSHHKIGRAEVSMGTYYKGHYTALTVGHESVTFNHKSGAPPTEEFGFILHTSIWTKIMYAS